MLADFQTAAFHFLAEGAAQLRSGPAALFVGRFGVHGRNRHGLAVFIDRHHGEVAGDDVAEGAFADAFGFHTHANFHRSGSGEVDRRPERHQLAHVHRGAKRHLVHRHGDHVAPGIARRAHIGHLVEQPQNGPAVHMPRKIGHVRRHQYGEGGGFAGNVFGHGVSRVPPGRWMCACFLGLPRWRNSGWTRRPMGFSGHSMRPCPAGGGYPGLSGCGRPAGNIPRKTPWRAAYSTENSIFRPRPSSNRPKMRLSGATSSFCATAAPTGARK